MALSKEMMFCPISFKPQTGHRQACAPADCAWFDTEAGTCAALSISRSLDYIAGRMDDMMTSGLPVKQ